MNSNEIKELIKSEISKYVSKSLDSDMKSILSKNSKTRDEMIRTLKDSLESVFKILWTKRDFWKNDIK